MIPPLTLRREPRWQDAALHPQALPEALRSWLLDRSSLTRRLQQRCSSGLRVELVALHWARPTPDEARLLAVPRQQRALIREVRLCCANQVWVYARTVIPLQALRGAQRRLAWLGNRPLGAVLFADPALRRSSLQVARLHGGNPLLEKGGTTQGEVWGRRSLFHLQGRPLLVSEFFLPGLSDSAPSGALLMGEEAVPG